MFLLLEEVFLDPHRLATSPNYAQIGSCFQTKVAARSRRVFCNPMRHLWLLSCGIWQVAITDSRLRFVCWQSAGPSCTWTWSRRHTEWGLGLCPHLFILAYRVLQLLLVVGRLYQCRPRPHLIQVPWKFNGFGTATLRITTETLWICVKNGIYNGRCFLRCRWICWEDLIKCWLVLSINKLIVKRPKYLEEKSLTNLTYTISYITYIYIHR